MIVDPRSMTVIDWTSQVTPLLDPFGTAGTLNDPSQWREWAANVAEFLDLQNVDTMNPYTYNDWVSWAMRFCEVTDTLLGN